MGKFKDFIVKHLGKSQDAKAVYNFLKENNYNNFDDFEYCDNFDGPDEAHHPSIATPLLRKKLRTLKDFVRLGGDYSVSLEFNQIKEQVKEAELKKCLITRLRSVNDEESKDTHQLLCLLRTILISQLNPYEVISQSHFSKEDSEEARNASIAYYGLASDKHCQILGQGQHHHVSVVNAHIWPRHKSELLPVWGVETTCIHDPKNVLRLQKDIERAFDARKVTFLETTGSGLELKVLCTDSSFVTSVLKGTKKTFSDMDGSLLLLPSGKTPYRRFLANHAVLAYKYAREKGWTTQDLSEIEMKAEALLAHSLDKEAQERLALLWA